MDSQKFETLSKAAEVAATRCGEWCFATARDELYDCTSLLEMAKIHDEESLGDEDSFYLVSPGGAIGFSGDSAEIDWLFIPLDSNEELPASIEPAAGIDLCPKCGSRTTAGARFCGACGTKL